MAWFIRGTRAKTIKPTLNPHQWPKSEAKSHKKKWKVSMSWQHSSTARAHKILWFIHKSRPHKNYLNGMMLLGRGWSPIGFSPKFVHPSHFNDKFRFIFFSLIHAIINRNKFCSNNRKIFLCRNKIS